MSQNIHSVESAKLAIYSAVKPKDGGGHLVPADLPPGGHYKAINFASLGTNAAAILAQSDAFLDQYGPMLLAASPDAVDGYITLITKIVDATNGLVNGAVSGAVVPAAS